MRKPVRLVFAVIAISLLTSFTYGQEQPRGTIKSVKGKAQLVSPEGKTKKAQPGQQVSVGDTLETDLGSVVDVSLAGETATLRLESNTILRITKLDIAKGLSTVLELDFGTLTGTVSPESRPSTFVIKTPEIEINMTGQEFAATAGGEISVIKGSAQITIGKDKITVAEGHVFDPESKKVGPIVAQKK